MNDFNQQVTEHLRGIVKATQNEISAARSKILSEIPKFSLKKIHCDSASLVLNRNELIKKMAPNTFAHHCQPLFVMTNVQRRMD